MWAIYLFKNLFCIHTCLVVEYIEPLERFDFVIYNGDTKNETEAETKTNSNQDMFKLHSDDIGIFHWNGRTYFSIISEKHSLQIQYKFIDTFV